MTYSDSTLVADVSTDARTRAFATLIDTALQGGGWVYVSQSGDQDPTTILHPTTTDSKKGFRVYRMDDTLQGTSPVFMRVDWGSGGNSTRPAMWITIGTGADGSGGITNQRLAVTEFQGNTQSTTASSCYLSSDDNRFSCGMYLAATNTGWFVFGVERAKDANGDDIGDGLIVMGMTSSGGGTAEFSQYVNMLSITQPTTETAWSYLLSHNNPSTFSSNVGVALVIPFAGAALQPGLNWAVVRSSDFSTGATFSVTAYGVSHTYQHLLAGSTPKFNAGSSVPNDSAARICMRFE